MWRSCIVHGPGKSRLNFGSQTPFTRYSRLSNRLNNRLDNRLNVCLHNATGCPVGCTTGCPTGWNGQPRLHNRLYGVNGVLGLGLGHLLLAGNDMWRVGGMRSAECPLILASSLC